LKKIVVLFGICILYCFSCFASTVEVEGHGISYRAAELDALRSAVERALGAIVDSDTLTRNSEVVEDNIFAHSQGYVTNYVILSQRLDNGDYVVNARVDVDTQPNSKLMSDLAKHGIIHIALRNPKIAILVDDRKFPQNHSPAQGVIAKKMLDAGFTNLVDVDTYSIRTSNFYEYDKVALTNLLKLFGADIVVVGRVSYGYVGDIGKYLGNGHKKTGVLSYQATFEAKMFIASTGRIVGLDTGTGKSVGITEMKAAKQASMDASTTVADSLINQLLNEGAGQKQIVELKVFTTDFSKLNLVKQALSNGNIVKNARLTSYSNGVGIFSVGFTGSPDLLYKMIEKDIDCRIQLLESGYASLQIKVY